MGIIFNSWLAQKLDWVPDNLSQLRKQIKDEPCLYGLPLFDLYYSKPLPTPDKVGFLNRIDGKNNVLHAFRIIIGIMWNAVAVRASGYEIEDERVDQSIRQLCFLFTFKKMERTNADLEWWQILEVDNTSTEWHFIMNEYAGLRMLFDEHADYKKALTYFKIRLAPYIVEDKALTTFIPLKTQKEYKDMYGNNAIKAYKAEWQQIFSIKADLTKPFDTWTIDYTEDELRHNCWLGGKTIQRLLSRTGRNTKSKHGRRRTNSKSPKAPQKCQLRCHSETVKETVDELDISEGIK